MRQSLGQFDTGPGQLAGVLFELALEPLEQGECVRRGAGKSGDHLALGKPAHLTGVGLHDGLADRDLPVAGDHDFAALAHRKDRRSVHRSVFRHIALPLGLALRC